MSVNTRTKAPDRRQEYLSAMGIDCWRPHVQLPGALISPVFARAVSRAEPAIRASGDAATRTAPKVPGRTAANIMDDVPVQRRASIVEKQQHPVSEHVGKTPEAHKDIQLNLLLLECPGHCLIIDDALGTHEQTALLQNLMFAMSAQPPSTYRATPFDWASIPPQGGAAADVLRGIVDRAVNQHSIRTIVIMGDSCRALFDCDAGVSGLVETPSWLAAEVRVIMTHSAKDLLLEAGKKADTWAHVQAAANSAVS